LATVLVVAAVSGGAGVSVAKDAVCDAAEAKRLFADGMKHLAAGEWDQACPRFEESLACHPRASAQTKVAGCREHEGRIAEALIEYQKALSLEVDPKKAREVEAEIQSFIDAIDARVPKLTITISPRVANLEIQLNGRPVLLSQLGSPLRVDPGEQRVTANAPGYPEAQVTVSLEEGASRDVAIVLHEPARQDPAPVRSPESSGGEISLPAVTPAATAAPAPAAAARPTTLLAAPAELTRAPRSSARRTAGLVAGGVAIVTLAVAGYFGLHTRSLVRQAEAQCYPEGTCDPGGIDTLNQARQAQLTGLVLGGLGVASAAAGAFLLVTDARERSGRVSAGEARVHARGDLVLSATMSPAGVFAQATW
jgi:hypothetical protein